MRNKRELLLLKDYLDQLTPRYRIEIIPPQGFDIFVPRRFTDIAREEIKLMQESDEISPFTSIYVLTLKPWEGFFRKKRIIAE